MNACIDELKLVALDRDDIEVVSAHVQDASVRVGDIFWKPHDRRFVMALNRFDWMSAVDAKALDAKALDVKALDTKALDAKPEQKPDYRRCRTALRFERVIGCKCRNLDPTSKEARLNLLAVEFAEREAPGGVVTLTFSGGGVIRLEVECLEAELADLGEVFAADCCPDHFAARPATA
jgi:Protein of unknown function (DUF2948)